ncbi:MAG: hypothetical protein ACXWQQ_07560 [Pseudobdellovibrio sp.]
MEILIAICILGTVTSQTLLDAGIILIFFCLLYSRFVKKEKLNYTFAQALPEKMILGYLVVVILGYLMPVSPDIPVAEYIVKFTWIVHLYLWIWAFTKIEYKPVRWIKFYCYAFLIPNIYALVSYWRGTDLLTGRDNIRITGLVNSSTYHAHGNAMIFVFFLALTLLNFKKLERKFQYVVVLSLILHTLSIFLTYTRGIWLALAVTAFYFLWLYRKKWTLYFTVFAGLCFIVLLISRNFFTIA